MRYLRILATLTLLAVTLACSPVEQKARDTAAALNGALSAAQTQYAATCATNAKQPACTTINQAVAGQNALVTAVEAYCGWNPLLPPPDKTATCVPVKGATAGLNAAISNATLFITELQGILTAKGVTP